MKLRTSSRLKVAISVPCPEYIHVEFSKALLEMHTHSRGMADYFVSHAVGSRITVNRNILVRMAQEMKATHLLFLDADMTFPPDTMLRLLAHEKDIVCATYSLRSGDHGRPIGELAPGTTGVADKKGLAEFALVGMGCMLLRMEVFDRLDKPYFAEPRMEGSDEPDGEDIDFCKQVRKAGYQIWCDVALSEQMGHIGRKIYVIDKTRTAPTA